MNADDLARQIIDSFRTTHKRAEPMLRIDGQEYSVDALPEGLTGDLALFCQLFAEQIRRNRHTTRHDWIAIPAPDGLPVEILEAAGWNLLQIRFVYPDGEPADLELWQCR